MKRAVADWSDELSKGANATLTSPHDCTVPFLVPSLCTTLEQFAVLEQASVSGS